MVQLFTNWYKRHFSDPSAIALLMLIVGIFLFVYFFSQLLMPVFVAIAIAFLLDLPVNKLQKNRWFAHGFSDYCGLWFCHSYVNNHVGFSTGNVATNK